jgi:poly(3-hydroxybutyrate) depolymerase
VLVYGSVALLAAWRAPGRTAPPDPDALAGASTELLAVTVPTGPDDPTPLTLDVALYVPVGVDASSPAPAVVLLHGFASDRTAQVPRAAQLVAQGYVVMVPKIGRAHV